MDRTVFKEIIALLNTIYSDKPPCPNQLTFDTWYAIFKDHSEEVVKTAAQMYISTNHFAPKPADLLEMCAELSKTEELTALEAWALVYKAICNSNYNAETEYKKLPPIVQRAVGPFENLKEMAQMDTKTVNSVEQSHFIRAYNSELAREKTINQMPSDIRARLGAINNRYSIESNDNVLVIESKEEPPEDNRVSGTEFVERLKKAW